MARKKQEMPEQEQGAEQQEMPDADPVTFPNDTWIYHEDEEPRILRAGEPMPEGWTTEPAELETKWKHDPEGKWSKGE